MRRNRFREEMKKINQNNKTRKKQHPKPQKLNQILCLSHLEWWLVLLLLAAKGNVGKLGRFQGREGLDGDGGVEWGLLLLPLSPSKTWAGTFRGFKKFCPLSTELTGFHLVLGKRREWRKFSIPS